MLRHACGFAVAHQDVDKRLTQDYLGHRNTQHTVKYTASNAGRLEAVALAKFRHCCVSAIRRKDGSELFNVGISALYGALAP
jgi:hypothetical protein